MQSEQWIVVAIAVVAVSALLAVVLLAVQLSRTRAQVRETARRLEDTVRRREADAQHGQGGDPLVPVLTGLPAHRPPSDDDSVVVTNEGRTIVLPSSGQVVDAAMGRPMVRGAVLSHGICYALRSENRDRIRSLVRREYRRRRKVRQRAARRAARNIPVSPADAQGWLGTRGRLGTRTGVPSAQEGRR